MSKEVLEKMIYSPDNNKFFDIYKDLISNKKKSSSKSSLKLEKVEDAATEQQRIKNEGMRQDIGMKKITLWILFSFLGVETLAIFCFTFFQAVGCWGFSIEEWSFKLLITATISQITVMLVIAVKHLFPNKQ